MAHTEAPDTDVRLGVLIHEEGGTKSPYEALGLESNASASEIREAYLLLSKALHPDRSKMAGDGAVPEQGVQERLREVQSAWYVLGNEERRKEYDEFGTLSAPSKAWSPGMWARLRKSRPDEGTLMPDWGGEEPPLWLIIMGPLSVVILAILFSARYDIYYQVRDNMALRAGSWPCPHCIVINEKDAERCKDCGDLRPNYIGAKYA